MRPLIVYSLNPESNNDDFRLTMRLCFVLAVPISLCKIMILLWLISPILTCDWTESLNVECTLGNFVLTREIEQCPFNNAVNDASNDDDDDDEMSSDIDSFSLKLCDATSVEFGDLDSFTVPFDHACVERSLIVTILLVFVHGK